MTSYAIFERDTSLIDGWYPDKEIADAILNYWDNQRPRKKHELVEWGDAAYVEMASDTLRRVEAERMIQAALEVAAEKNQQEISLYLIRALAHISDRAWSEAFML